MPLLNKSFCLATLTTCMVGMCCTNLSAQATNSPPRRATTNYGSPPQGPSGARTTKTASAPGRAPLEDAGGAPAGDPRGGAPIRQARPVAQPYRIPKLSPQMEDILVEWETKSSKIKRLEGSFIRTTYDSVFAVEQVSSGKYCFQFPDMGSFQQTGVKKGAGEQGHRFVRKAGPDERWVCDGTKILKIDDKVKQYEEVTIPAEDRGQNIRNSPLPFLFGMKADEAKQRYAFELDEKKTNEKTIWLKVYPLQQQDLANYKKAEVMLDRTNCLPIAVKLYDTTGNKEDVYYFDQGNMTVNGRTWSRFFTGIDPLKPDLGGYKKALAPENAAAPAGRQLIAPAGVRRTPGIQPEGVRGAAPRTRVERTAELPDDDQTPPPPARRRLQP